MCGKLDDNHADPIFPIKRINNVDPTIPIDRVDKSFRDPIAPQKKLHETYIVYDFVNGFYSLRLRETDFQLPYRKPL